MWLREIEIFKINILLNCKNSLLKLQIGMLTSKRSVYFLIQSHQRTFFRCLFLFSSGKKKARKFVDLIDGEVWRWEAQDPRGLGGLDTVIRIYCMKNYLLSIKKIGIKFLK